MASTITITSNDLALSAQRTMTKSLSQLEASMTRLSSGMRINSAKDDGAGLSIATRVSMQIRGLDHASRGMEKGIGMVQTADGALGEITDLLVRQRELAVQAANGSNDADQFQGLSDQMKELNTTIDRIAGSTRFEERKLLDGSLKDFQIPIDAVGRNTASLTISSTGSGDPAGFDSKGLGLSDITLDSAQAGTAAVDTLDAAIKTVSEQRSALGTLQNRVLTTGLNSIMSVSFNLSDARSRIADSDFAMETAGLARGQILQQAGMAMLAQANQSGQAVMSLLR